mmetsp:Transcript_110643/g.247249  ORF Transcript_110643/g.247249 Transcript_110643/m.247249 type:complete len:195 (-) Transcript_110643:95-679(-)
MMTASVGEGCAIAVSPDEPTVARGLAGDARAPVTLPEEAPQPWWYRLLVPSYSGTKVTLGAYAQADEVCEVSSGPPSFVPGVQAATALAPGCGSGHTEADSGNRDDMDQEAPANAVVVEEASPWWYRLLVPSHSGTVAELGGYADAAELPEEIRQAQAGSAREVVFPWISIGQSMGLGAPDPAIAAGTDGYSQA